MGVSFIVITLGGIMCAFAPQPKLGMRRQFDRNSFYCSWLYDEESVQHVHNDLSILANVDFLEVY